MLDRGALKAENIAELNSKLSTIDAAAAKAFERMPNSDPRKALLKAAMEDMASAQKQLNPAIEEAMQALDATHEDTAKRVDKLREKQEKLEDKLAVASAAATQPPAPKPLAPADPALPGRLHDEFIKEYGGFLEKQPRDAKPVDAGSIARHWNESEEAEGSQASQPAPPLAPPPFTPTPATPGSGVFKTVRKKSIPPQSAPPKSAPPKSAPPKSGDAWEGLSQSEE